MLEVSEIHTYYGLSHILFGVSLEVSRGECVCLLGRNGAGKSTTMRSIMGLTPPKRGYVRFQGVTCTGEKPYLLARRGVGYVPDDRRVFADLTVGENLEISARNFTEGLAPLIVQMLEEQIHTLKKSGLTVLLAEQNLSVTLRLSDRGYVIDNGVIRYHGSTEDLQKNEDVRRKYLCV